MFEIDNYHPLSSYSISKKRQSLMNQTMKSILYHPYTINNIFDSGGFSMTRTKPLIYGIDYIKPGFTGGSEFTDMLSSRNGKTYSITFQYNFGELMEERKKYRSLDDKGGGGMDMGY